MVGVELFVAVLGAANYAFVTTTLMQCVADFVSSHVKSFEYFRRRAARHGAGPTPKRGVGALPVRADGQWTYA
jgi:hypothetical protein